MSIATDTDTIQTLADLLERLGDIPLQRVRFRPPPGTATESDVLEAEGRDNRLCELVDGTLVEKGMGYQESLIALAIGSLLREFVVPRNLGLVSGADGMVRLFPGLVRIPDVAFVSWDRIPDGRVPPEPIPELAPDLVVEVLSPSNTVKEMRRKRREYFEVGVRLVWSVDPADRTVAVDSAPETSVKLDEARDDVLDGGEVLPGFVLPLRTLFGELDRRVDDPAI